RLRLRSFRSASISIAVGGAEDSVDEAISSSPPKTFPMKPGVIKTRDRQMPGRCFVIYFTIVRVTT
ncbi:MAG: hypothetical protein AAB243_03240, partial [Planctomycetota bacterium]